MSHSGIGFVAKRLSVALVGCLLSACTVHSASTHQSAPTSATSTLTYSEAIARGTALVSRVKQFMPEVTGWVSDLTGLAGTGCSDNGSPTNPTIASEGKTTVDPDTLLTRMVGRARRASMAFSGPPFLGKFGGHRAVYTSPDGFTVGANVERGNVRVEATSPCVTVP